MCRDKWTVNGGRWAVGGGVVRWRWMPNRSCSAALLIDDCVFGRSDTAVSLHLQLQLALSRRAAHYHCWCPRVWSVASITAGRSEEAKALLLFYSRPVGPSITNYLVSASRCLVSRQLVFSHRAMAALFPRVEFVMLLALNSQYIRCFK